MTDTNDNARADGLEEIERKYGRAMDVIYALCDGRRKWSMSVPARPDHDADIILADAIRFLRDAAIKQSTLPPTAPTQGESCQRSDCVQLNKCMHPEQCPEDTSQSRRAAGGEGMPVGKLCVMGDLETTDGKFPMALLITFPDVATIRRAINEGACRYEFGTDSGGKNGG